jgi:hypothetical protein
MSPLDSHTNVVNNIVTQYITLDPKLTNLISDYTTYLGPILVQGIGLVLLVGLAIFEVKVKLEAKALEILLHKNKSSTRQVLGLNCAQILLYVGAVYLRLCSPEFQALAAYSLAAKLIQTNWQQLKVDILTITPTILPTILFAFMVKPNNSISIIEGADQLIIEVTQQVIPVILVYLSIIVYPIIFITLVISSTAYCFFRFLASLRRRFPDDFDFFLTLAISILAFKTVKRDLVQTQLKDMVCSKLKFPTSPAYSGISDLSFGLPGGLSRAGSGVETQDSDAQLALQHWCLSNDNIIRSIAKVVRNPVRYGEVEEVVKPENMSYLHFYTELITSYRGYHIMAARPAYKPGACWIDIVLPPRETGFYGLMRGAAYKMYVLASWVLPDSYQDYLSVFGFKHSNIEIETQMNCSALSKQMLVEKI